MQGYLYMEDRGGSGHQRWGTPVTPASSKPTEHRGGVVPRKLIALDKAALGVSEGWRDRISLKCTKRKDSKESSVRVVARFRPPSEKELQAEGRDCERAFTVCPESHRVDTVNGGHSWEFDMAFGEDCSQEAVYNATGRPVISSILDGYNGTIFAYGQTGSGKTHCMFGPSHDLLYQTSDYRGIVPRAAQHVFDHIRDGVDGSEYVLRCSLFEVYREQLRDLLHPANPNLRIKETPRQGVFVDGLAQEFVACEDDIVQLLRAGSRLRAVAATRLNQHSSRSHVIFSLTCEQRLVDGTEKLAKLNLVDLAGSEKVWKSSSSGVTLEEAKKINLSLSALGNVINALASRTASHVPYRNSKLTRILQETLGGNFKTALVVTCSPLQMHIEETHSSLHFATRAKAVCNHVKMNFVYSAEQLMAFAERLQHELLTTRREIAKFTGGPIPAALPEAMPRGEAPIFGIGAASPGRPVQWDAELLDGPSPAPKPKRQAPRLPLLTRLMTLAEETKLRFSCKLVEHEELMGDVKAVIGAGLAHELRACAGATLMNGSGPMSASPSDQVTAGPTLDAHQDFLQKLLKKDDIRKRLALVHRSLRTLQAKRSRLSGYCDRLDAQVTQTQQAAADLQSAHEALPECRNSPSPSRLHSPIRQVSASSELGTLRGEIVASMSAPSTADVSAVRSFSVPEVLQTGQRPVASSVSAPGADASGDLGPNEALRRELEMLEVDFEREEAMRHLHIKEDNADWQHWCRRAHAKLRDLDQAANEEPRLYDLVQRRRTELVRNRERLARCQQEVQAKEHELSTNTRLDTHSSSATCAPSNEDANLQSKCLELNEAIIRLKNKSDSLREERTDTTFCLPGVMCAPKGGAKRADGTFCLPGVICAPMGGA